MKLPIIFSGKRRWLFARLFGNAVSQAALLFLNAMLIRYTFDHFIHRPSPLQSHFILIAVVMCMGPLVNGWLQRNERLTAERLGQSYVHSLRMRLFRHVSRLDPRLLQRRRRGAVMLKFVGDLNAARRWVSLGIVRIVVSGAIITTTLSLLFMINWLLSLITAMLIIAGILINIRIGESLRDVARETRKRRSRLTGNINEKLARMSVIQVFGRRDDEIKRVRRQSAYLRKALVDRAGKIGSIRSVTHCCAALAVVAVLFVGVYQMSNGSTTPGMVAAAMVVIGFLVPALKNLGRVNEYYQDFHVAMDKLSQFMKIKTRIKLGAKLPEFQAGTGRLRLEGVVVKGVFDRVTAEAKPGQVVAIVGPNGAGKSVLIDLVARLITPDEGKVRIDGQDIARYSLKSARQMVGIVSPDLPLLSGSIEKNLRYRSPDSSPDEVEKIKRLCGVDDLIRQLPRGEHTKIREGGRNLSMGQRSRILMARALLGGPRILLLDEVDAHLDARARQAVQDVIRTFSGTVLWVTHRQIPLVGVDAVWRIEKGQIKPFEIQHIRRRQERATA